MAITATDLLYKLSTSTSPGNSAAGTPATSLGGYVSTTEITDATLNNLFDNVSGPENTAFDVEYRCMFIHNNHASLTLQSSVVWVSSEVAGGADVAIGLDPAGVTAKGSASPQAATVADEDTAPAGVTFSTPTTKVGGLSIGDIPAGSVAAIWVRRSATDSGSVANDGATIRIEGDTAP